MIWTDARAASQKLNPSRPRRTRPEHSGNDSAPPRDIPTQSRADGSPRTPRSSLVTPHLRRRRGADRTGPAAPATSGPKGFRDGRRPAGSPCGRGDGLIEVPRGGIGCRQDVQHPRILLPCHPDRPAAELDRLVRAPPGRLGVSRQDPGQGGLGSGPSGWRRIASSK